MDKHLKNIPWKDRMELMLDHDPDTIKLAKWVLEANLWSKPQIEELAEIVNLYPTQFKRAVFEAAYVTHSSDGLATVEDFLFRCVNHKETGWPTLTLNNLAEKLNIYGEKEEAMTEEKPANDPVNHPPHYTQGGIECIDAIRAALGEEGFRAYCRGNVIKYTWREKHKNGDEDLKKAQWYINRLIESAK